MRRFRRLNFKVFRFPIQGASFSTQERLFSLSFRVPRALVFGFGIRSASFSIIPMYGNDRLTINK